MSLHILRGWLTPNTQDLFLGIIPAHSFVLQPYAATTELWNSDGSDTIEVGYEGDPNAYGTSIGVDATDKYTLFSAGVEIGLTQTAQRATATYTNSGSEPTTGRTLVILPYYRVPS